MSTSTALVWKGLIPRYPFWTHASICLETTDASLCPTVCVGTIRGVRTRGTTQKNSKTMKMMFTILERVPIVLWRSVFENTRRLKGLLIRVLHIVSDGLSSEYCIAAYLFSQKICRLRRKSGLLHTALYLKQCAVVLQKFYGEGKYSHELLKPQVSLTRSGLPRLIPAFHRKVIRQGGDRGDRAVKIYLSWFSLGRVVLLAPKVTAKTFDSLLDPSPDLAKTVNFIHGLVPIIRTLLPRYLPGLSTRPVHQGLRWVPTWKSTPTGGILRKHGTKKSPVSLFDTLGTELAVFNAIVSKMENAFKVHPTSMLPLGEVREVYPLPPEDLVTDIKEFLEVLRFGITIQTIWIDDNEKDPSERVSLPVAKVASSMAGAGKRRLFIIGNYVIQRLLRPYGDWLMSVLRTLPGDGTFNQLKPLHNVMGRQFVASYDLKSATDRWPRYFMGTVLCMLFGRETAQMVTEGCLGSLNILVGRPLTKSVGSVTFTVGSPLGFYAAWPLFALTHHILVWCAAEAVYPGKYFKTYGLLGDDLVIGDRRVADAYMRMLSYLDVEISISKSLISNKGAFEFAKKYFIRCGEFDCSPISLRLLLLARSTLGLATIRNAYTPSLRCLLRLAGAGYRVMSRLSPLRFSNRWARLVVFLSYNPAFTDIAFEWWLGGFKRPLDPYLKGELYWWVLSKVKPRQLSLPVETELTPHGYLPQVLDLAEITFLREWVLQWLAYWRWYAEQIAWNQGSLMTLLKPPVVETSWKRRTVDPTIHRYSLVWKLYDRAQRRDIKRIRPLPEKAIKEQLQYPVLWRVRD